MALPRTRNLVVLVDTFSVFFRAYYALPMMHTTSGEPTSALYGFCSLLLKVLREQKPSELMFALDGPKPTFRRERYGAYKAQRSSIPSDLAAQLDRLHELLTVLELPVFAVPGFEADDVLATLAARLRAQQTPGLVVSGDRDLLQTAHGSISVLFIGARGKDAKIYDGEAVAKRFGVAATSLADYIALVGDTSDNLPGVPGIGPRTAALLLSQFETVTKLLENLDSVTPPRIRESLRTGIDQVQLNLELARLHDDIPLPEPTSSARLDAQAIARLRQVFEELEFKSLLPRLDKLTALDPQSH